MKVAPYFFLRIIFSLLTATCIAATAEPPEMPVFGKQIGIRAFRRGQRAIIRWPA